MSETKKKTNLKKVQEEIALELKPKIEEAKRKQANSTRKVNQAWSD